MFQIYVWEDEKPQDIHLAWWKYDLVPWLSWPLVVVVHTSGRLGPEDPAKPVEQSAAERVDSPPVVANRFFELVAGVNAWSRCLMAFAAAMK